MNASRINQIPCGDAKQLLRHISDQSVDLIFTSSPYAKQRKKQKVDWLIPIADQLKQILKPAGRVFINIKENVIQGELCDAPHHSPNVAKPVMCY